MSVDIDLRKKFLIKRYSKGRVLNIGCGNLYIRHSINMDKDSNAAVDIIGDFHNIPFKDKSFDIVFAFDIIEHTKTPELLLKELERVGKNIIIECLDFDICKDNWNEDKTHVYYINKEIYKNLIRGFHIVSFSKGQMLIGIIHPKLFDRQLCFVYRNFNWTIYRYRRALKKLVRELRIKN